ncbi:MAG TPA: hypothetical protein VGB16_01395 [candidate division Zixibacteria bacterium]
MRKLSKSVMLIGVIFLIFGWSGVSFAEYEVFFVPSFQDSFTTTRPEIRIKFPKGGVGPTKVAIDTLKRCANEPYYGFIDSTGRFPRLDSIYYTKTSPADTIVRAGFGDSMYQTDGYNVLCLFWDTATALPARDSASGKPAYALKVDSAGTVFRYPLTPCKYNVSRAGELVVKPAHKSNDYTNRTPIFQAEFSIFKEVKGDTTWYDGVFLDTNLTVVLKATGITDTLYDYKRFPQLRPGLIGNLRKIHPGKMVFTISWLDTSYYLPLDMTKAYIDSVTGGVWDYQGLSIICGSPPLGYSPRGVADTFWVDGTPPEMELQEMNYVSKSPYFLLKASDAKAGVNTDSLFVDLYKVELYGEAPPDDSVEDRSYLKSLQVEGLDPSLGSVLVNTGVELEDVEGGMALDVWVFNGRPFDVNEYMTNLDAVYPDSLGPMDGAGNLITPLYKRFYVDGIPANVRLSSNSTHEIRIFEISDTSSCYQVDTLGHVEILCSGVNTASVKLYENFQLVTPDSTKYNSSSGAYSVYYSPTSENVWINLDVADKVGNIATYQNYYEDDQLNLVEPHNYPNPFSPVSPIVDHRRTVIDPGLTRTTDMELTIDIYDLAGHHVVSVTPNMADGGRGYWDGRTKDGTLVANGVYLCYIQARDTAQNKTLTEVIKIAVAKNDKRIF